jgi:adenine-specific DNA-methyltransferase
MEIARRCVRIRIDPRVDRPWQRAVSSIRSTWNGQEGECSICQKRFTNKADYCPHLRNFKGREYNGRPVYEILHGVTFTGLGLLDRKGADENARILQVAAVEDTPDQSQSKGDPTMTDKTKTNKDPSKSDTEGAKKKPEEKGADPAARVTELEKENRQLKAQVTELQKRIEELESEQKAAALLTVTATSRATGSWARWSGWWETICLPSTPIPASALSAS